MKRKVKALWIVKISTFLMEIFNEEDNDYVDGRKVAIWQRHIDKYLSYFSEDKQEQKEVLEIIESENWNAQDRTYKTMFNRIRKLGYEILDGKQ